MTVRISRFLLGMLIAGVSIWLLSSLALAAPAASHTYLVNSTLDEPDGDPTTLPCASSPSGKCTLRAAIMSAIYDSGPDTINLPAGTYTLTRSGLDDAGLIGDLDIAHSLTVLGAGSGATIVDGNGAVTGDRVFQDISASAPLTLTGLTIRNGRVPSYTAYTDAPEGWGGGLYFTGTGQLHLSDMIIQNNQATAGGGLYLGGAADARLSNVTIEGNQANSSTGGGLDADVSLSGGSIDLDHVSIHGNTAYFDGGGLYVGAITSNPSTIRDSQIYSNSAEHGYGGGQSISTVSQWIIERSQIYSNTAFYDGGGLYIGAPLVLSDSSLYANHATYDGGAIQAYQPFIILRTSLTDNTAGRSGGGINVYHSVSPSLYPEFIISQSTLSGNYGQYGGGLNYDGHFYASSRLALVNSTLSGNTVSNNGHGGGLYVIGGQTQLLNATVAYNRVQLGYPTAGSGLGGGVYVTGTAVFTAANSLIAQNTRGNSINPDTADDCFTAATTALRSLGYNTIETTTKCTITGTTIGNIVGQDPLLGPLQNNGGSTLTRAPLPGSPVIDAGNPTGCTDQTGAALTVDQRGWFRPNPVGAVCDRGAVEYYPPSIFLPLILK